MTLRIVALDDYQGLAAEPLSPAALAGAGLDDAELIVRREHLTGDALTAGLAGARVAIAMRERTRFDESLLAALPDLELIVTTGMRNAAIDVAAAARHGVTVCGTGGVPNANTAELTWALILGLLRRLPAEDASVRAGGWQHTVGRDLLGSRLGLVGLGRIGQQVARVGLAFGMDVVAWSQNLSPEVAAEAGVTAVTKAELFASSDVISVHLVLSDRSRGLIGEPELRAMKPDAVLVNSSRGPIVDHDALVRALREGWIGGAALDVYDTEPLPPGDELRDVPHTLLSPHIGFVTRRTMDHWYRELLEDIAAWHRGQPIRELAL